MNRNAYDSSLDYEHLNNKSKAHFEINELDSLSSIDNDDHSNKNNNEEPLIYESSSTNQTTTANLILNQQLNNTTSYLMKIEKHHLPKYKQRKSFSSLTNTKLNKEKEAFYARLSKPKRVLNEDRLSYSKDNSIIHNKQGTLIGENACNRLYELSRDCSMKKERLKREYEEEINKQYPFSPEINREKGGNEQLGSLPLLERFRAFEEAKYESLKKRITEQRKLETFTHQPMLNQNSMNIVNQMALNRSAYTTKPLQTENIRLSRYNNSSHKEELECSFTPKLYSSKLRNKSSGNIKTFLNRSKDYAEESRLIKQKQVIIMEKKHNEKYTFKPKINSASEFLASFINETPQARYNRMSRLTHEDNMSKKEKLKEQYDSQYAYKPSINHTYNYCDLSPLRAKSTAKTSKDWSKQSEIEAASYTFKPHTNASKYPEVQSQYFNDDDNIMERIECDLNKREEKREEYKRALDEKEIEECLFSPQINHYSPKYYAQPDIKGYDRYIDQMRQVRNKKKEQEEQYQARFFTSEYCNRRGLSITKPQPFNLSTQQNHYSTNHQIRLTSKDHQKNKDMIRQMLTELQ